MDMVKRFLVSFGLLAVMSLLWIGTEAIAGENEHVDKSTTMLWPAGGESIITDSYDSRGSNHPLFILDSR
ncbi:hypothetical protein [Bacillus fonticola]|uniref:hypothetical protein n=1 Tax=Bacillus fonticola TaxID=2728853 RepID=UPI001473713A|nr:hypothetical protein [Bacillus fonticola]